MTKLLKHLGKYKPLNVLKINLQIGFEKATNCLSFKLLEIQSLSTTTFHFARIAKTGECTWLVLSVPFF